MEDQTITPRRPRIRFALGAGLLVAGAVAGGVLAGTLSASATSGSGGPSASTGYGAAAAPQQGGTPQPGGKAPVRSDEKTLSVSLTAKLRAAALKAVPGGTVYRIESDAGDGAYEAHMSKADGTLVTVKFDKSGAVTKVESGMGTGDPQLGGGPSR